MKKIKGFRVLLRVLLRVCGALAVAALAYGHARAQSAAADAQVSFCKIDIPPRLQESKDSVAFRFRVNLQGSPTGITLVRRGLFGFDDQPFRDCISRWRLPVTDQQYLATFSTHDSGFWQEIDVDSKTFHRKLTQPSTNPRLSH